MRPAQFFHWTRQGGAPGGAQQEADIPVHQDVHRYGNRDAGDRVRRSRAAGSGFDGGQDQTDTAPMETAHSTRSPPSTRRRPRDTRCACKRPHELHGARRPRQHVLGLGVEAGAGVTRHRVPIFRSEQQRSPTMSVRVAIDPASPASASTWRSPTSTRRYQRGDRRCRSGDRARTRRSCRLTSTSRSSTTARATRRRHSCGASATRNSILRASSAIRPSPIRSSPADSNAVALAREGV